MSRTGPRVSIGMPVYNGERFIREALDSILGQTFTDFELIISDNASTDRTEEICRSYASRDDRIRYYRNEKNLGAIPNFNRVFELSSGAYFKWAAHDDVLAKEYLQQCVTMLDRSPSRVVLCFPLMTLIDGEGTILKYCDFLSNRVFEEGSLSYRELRFPDVVRLTSARIVNVIWGLMRTSALRKTHLFNAYLATDLVLATELSLLGEFRQIPEYLFLQRLYGQQKVRATQSREENAMWLDTSDTSPSLFTVPVQYVTEAIKVIARSNMRWSVKLLRYFQISGFLHQIFRQWLDRVIGRTWCAVSQIGVRISSFTYFPLRLWAVGRFMRHRYGWRVGAAILEAWRMSEYELLHCTALALVGRSDAASRELLADWLDATRVVQRSAAAAAIAESLTSSPKCAGAYPLSKSKQRAYALMLAERLGTETSEEILRTIVGSLTAYGNANDMAIVNKVLSHRADLHCDTIGDLRIGIDKHSNDRNAMVHALPTP